MKKFMFILPMLATMLVGCGDFDDGPGYNPNPDVPGPVDPGETEDPNKTTVQDFNTDEFNNFLTARRDGLSANQFGLAYEMNLSHDNKTKTEGYVDESKAETYSLTTSFKTDSIIKASGLEKKLQLEAATVEGQKYVTRPADNPKADETGYKTIKTTNSKFYMYEEDTTKTAYRVETVTDHNTSYPQTETTPSVTQPTTYTSFEVIGEEQNFKEAFLTSIGALGYDALSYAIIYNQLPAAMQLEEIEPIRRYTYTKDYKTEEILISYSFNNDGDGTKELVKMSSKINFVDMMFSSCENFVRKTRTYADGTQYSELHRIDYNASVFTAALNNPAIHVDTQRVETFDEVKPYGYFFVELAG